MEHGAFSTSDLIESSAPVIASLGKNTHQIAERFNKYGVEAVVYVHEKDVESETLTYEDLKKEVLDEVLIIAEDWEAECLKTEKRCAD